MTDWPPMTLLCHPSICTCHLTTPAHDPAEVPAEVPGQSGESA